MQKEKEILLEIGRRKQLQSLKQYQDTVLSTVDKTVGEPHNTQKKLADKRKGKRRKVVA